jgi:hypothetical protein
MPRCCIERARSWSSLPRGSASPSAGPTRGSRKTAPNKALRKLKIYFGRVIGDIIRKIADDAWLQSKFAWLLNLARRVREQERGQRGPKVYSLHAPEVEGIGKGKPHKPTR